MGIPLETWVFVAILVLTGFLVIICGLQKTELSLAFIVAGTVIASLSSIVVSKTFRKWLEHL
jgi:hypothetical protein